MSLKRTLTAFEQALSGSSPYKVGPEPSDREIRDMGGKIGTPGPYKVGPEPSDKEIRDMGGKVAAQDSTWAKLRDGSWGVRVPHSARPGQEVVVRKKSGQTAKVTLGTKVWTDNRTVWLFTVEKSGSGGSSSQNRSRPQRGRRPGGRYECQECGEYVTPGTRCWETGMMH
jgi:hypothetical protein